MVFERKGFDREMVSNCNVGATTYTVCWWALTEGQHRPKAGKKKKTREAGLFFLVPTSQVMLHPKWVKRPFPDWKRGSIIHIVVAGHTEIGVDRQGYGFFDLDVSDDSEFFPSFGRS